VFSDMFTKGTHSVVVFVFVK